jgi:hypothetical protein
MGLWLTGRCLNDTIGTNTDVGPIDREDNPPSLPPSLTEATPGPDMDARELLISPTVVDD